MNQVLSINHFYKSYGSVQALKGVSFNVPEGSIFGILGPNGSGKTTTLGIILDILKADAGSYSWLGSTANKNVRNQIGTLLETPNFYHYLSAADNLLITQAISQRGVKEDIDAVLKLVDLYERRKSKFKTFSLGMKQRLAIAAALLGNPKIVVLDEPTNGLDPNGILEIRELIKRLAKEGKTVIMASHLLDEVEKVCTHVAILKNGELITTGTVNEILSQDDTIELSCDNTESLYHLLQHFEGVKNISKNENAVELNFAKGKANAALINKFCFENGITLSQIQFKRKSLETKFFELTNN
ncbi:MAG: ABC transporter ATP-binding protein [Chitinophagaceae bacterium]